MNPPICCPSPPARNRGGRPRRVLDPNEIRRLMGEGLSIREIARRLRAGYGTVYRMAQGLGLIHNRSKTPPRTF